jgi:ribosomal-protein-alanine N-acetyltransferase
VTALGSATIVVRRAERRDLSPIVAIERLSFSDPWTEQSFVDALALDRMRMLVAEEPTETGRGGASELVGYVLALVVGEEAELADLAVAPRARRRGIGRMLLERIVEQLRADGVRSLYLEVRESNVAARTLYLAHAFAAVGRRRGYYRHPVEDALLLKREIAPT